MTRIFTCGFEFNSLSEQNLQTFKFAENDFAISTGGGTGQPSTPRSGSYFFVAGIDRFNGRWAMLRKNLAAVAEVYGRFVVYPNNPSTLGLAELHRIYDAGGTQVLGISLNSSSVLSFSSSTGINSSAPSNPLTENTWNVLEYRFKADTGTAGLLTIWLNNTQIYTASGVKTSSGQSNCVTFDWGVNMVNGAAAIFRASYDDIAINDTAGSVNNGRCGNGKVVLLKPTGAGSSAGMTRGGTDSGANWSQVDEVPPVMTDYVYHATDATRDLYAAQDLPSEAGAIALVEVHALAQNSDAGAGSLGLTLKSSSTTSEATAQVLTSGAAYYRAAYETDPATTAAWTPSGVNAAEIGVTVR